MIGSLGLPEILFILVLALLVFGPKRLPKVGRTLGKALGEFRRATSDLKQTIDREINTVDVKDEPAPRRPKLAAVESPEPAEAETEAETEAEPETEPEPDRDGEADAAPSPDAPDASETAPDAPVARTELASKD